MPSIFISYRRDDSTGSTGRLWDRLCAEFGKGQVFRDIDTIEPSADFVEIIEQTVAACDVVLVVIGKHWLTVCDEQGRPRIENPEDFVRLEVGTALSRTVRVVPVLVEGARMPRSDQLPAALADLSRRNALELPDRGFHQALDRLIALLRLNEAKVREQTEQERLARETEARELGERERLAHEAAIQERAEKERQIGGNETIVPGRRAAPAVAPRMAVPALRAGQTKVNPKDGLTYVWIPPGTFTMGCSRGDSECRENEEPAHQVTITTGFWIGQTPATQEAYQRVMGKNPSYFKGAQLPVENVNWDKARSYCQAVGMRLPTEAEWEYAARAGSTTSRYGDIDQVAWYTANSGSKTHEVAQKQPNAWDLYDMLGNVWEWTSDWYADKY